MPVDSAEPMPDAGFDVVRRGYDQGQVDMHLRRIDAEISILAADRDAAVDQSTQLGRELEDARARAEKLRAQVRTLAGPPQSVQGMSERMRSMLRLAEDEVSDMLAGAEKDAARRREEAEQEAERTLAAAKEEAERTLTAARDEAASYLGPAQVEATELAERTAREKAQLVTDRIAMERAVAADREAMEREIAELRATTEARLAEERATVEQALAAQRAGVEREVAALVRRSEEERARLWAQAQAQRDEVEQDFAIAMDQRRTEALAALAAERASTRREIDGMHQSHAERVRVEIVRAEEHAHRIVAAAERRVAELTALRGRIAEQLGGTQYVLSRALASLAPVEGEPGARTNGYAPAPSTPVPAPQSPPRQTPPRPAPAQAPAEPPTVQLKPDTLTDLEPVAAPTSDAQDEAPSADGTPTPTDGEVDTKAGSTNGSGDATDTTDAKSAKDAKSDSRPSPQRRDRRRTRAAAGRR
ncbi:hypothetical protein [Pseudonocardia oceani]|uniref:DivIVA protein n=2 Tax=Pseudonocardia oceani TaxID=2792013 RepID=A0ABS6U5U9_9PSEU|nr:hypothetical protein [Pseudonocardia oceani]MBW0127591.1 hypothetical protein [Pseudonocardia oceani]